MTLDTEGGHGFLSDAALILLAAGFGILPPGWWTNLSVRVGVKLSVSTPTQPGSAEKKGVIGQEGLVDFPWDLAVGQYTLTGQEVGDLVEAQQPLVQQEFDTARPASAVSRPHILLDGPPADDRLWGHRRV